MKFPYVTLGLALAMPLMANDALDLLEGKKDANSIVVPPAPEDAPPISGAIGAKNSRGKALAPYRPMELSDFAKKSHELLDPVWARTKLVNAPDNPYVQEFSLTGLFEGSGAWGDLKNDLETSDLNQNVSETALRRAQLGARMKAFYRTEITGLVETAGPSRMTGIQNLSARTRLRGESGVTLGKFRPLSTAENNTADADLTISERSLLSNMIAPADSLGVMFDAKRKGWTYRLGWFSNDFDDQMPRLNNDGVINAGIAHESKTSTESGAPLRTRWFLNYLYNVDDQNSSTTPRHQYPGASQYQSVVATGLNLQMDRLGFLAEFAYANGDSSVWGLTLSPTYWLMPGALQLVTRYHFADTESADALYGGYGPNADPFFEGNGPIVSGDEFHSFYLGANFHLHENRMVISNGVEYTIFHDDLDSGNTTESMLWQTGAKLSF
jgi:hypothetical protein